MLAILCGTSNAVLTGGYAAGLADAGCTILNLATGASPSPQLISQAPRILEQAGNESLLVIDNIINDENLLDLDMPGVRRAIAAQYVLARDIAPTPVCFGLGARQYFPAGSAIERLHRAVCAALDIPFISFREIMSACCPDPADHHLLFEDGSHIRRELSRLIAEAGTRYILGNRRRQPEPFAPGRYDPASSHALVESDGERPILTTGLRTEQSHLCSQITWTFAEPQRLFGLYIDRGQTTTIAEILVDGRRFYKSLLYTLGGRTQFMFVPFAAELDVARSVSIRAHRVPPAGESVERSIHENADPAAATERISVIDLVRLPSAYIARADRLLSAIDTDRTAGTRSTHILSADLQAGIADLVRKFRQR